MTLTYWGIAGILVLFAVIIASGFWMSSLGKPYNTGIFTVHKLIAIAAVVILTVIAVKTGRASGLNGYETTGIIVTGVVLLGTLVSGGIMSVMEAAPAAVLRVHQVFPFLSTVTAGVTLFLFK